MVDKMITENRKTPQLLCCKINQSAVQKHLEKLKEIGVLKKVGHAKGGHLNVVT